MTEYKCIERCGNYRGGNCMHESRLGTGEPHQIKPGDECLFPHACILNQFIAIQNSTSQRSSNTLTLREKIGLGLQITGLAGLLGSAAGFFYQGLNHTSDSNNFLIYLITASFLTLFSGCFTRGLNKSEE